MRNVGLCALFLAVMLLAVPGFAADALLGVAPAGWESDAIPTLQYNPDNGILQLFAARVDGNTAEKVNMTAINITSDPALFDPAIAKTDVPILSGGFDNIAGNNLFLSVFGGSFNDVPFVTSAGGGVMLTGLASDAILAAFTTTGALEGGGGLPPLDLVVVPEPAGLVLLSLGLVGLLAWRRRR